MYCKMAVRENRIESKKVWGDSQHTYIFIHILMIFLHTNRDQQIGNKHI